MSVASFLTPNEHHCRLSHFSSCGMASRTRSISPCLVRIWLSRPDFFVRASSRDVYDSGFMHRTGWSASAAIGASLASGGKPALALMGDGSFIMRATVMMTAVEQKLPVVAVVFDNRTLQIEREAMIKIYGREALCDYRQKGENDL
ncbi:MAG: hypothetical protein E5V40_25645 [Mesorhizobium sp.]|nr:MAG: hypothetical protein E5V40_25645 [Mesorhizobium sp.]